MGRFHATQRCWTSSGLLGLDWTVLVLGVRKDGCAWILGGNGRPRKDQNICSLFHILHQISSNLRFHWSSNTQFYVLLRYKKRFQLNMNLHWILVLDWTLHSYQRDVQVWKKMCRLGVMKNNIFENWLSYLRQYFLIFFASCCCLETSSHQ